MLRRILLATLTIAALALPGAGLPVAADEHPAIVVEFGKPVTKTYDTIPGNFPAAPNVNPWPVECANEFAAVCDNVPITVIPPGDLGESDVYFLSLEVSWDDPEGLNDLDIYLWDDRQIEAEAGDASPSYTELNRSASSDNPESIKQLVGSLNKVNLTIVNWAGPNLGYTLEASLSIVEFDPPFESLAPTFSPAGPSDDGGDFAVTPFDFSTSPAPGIDAPVAPTFGEVPVQPDSELDFGPSDFDSALARPPAVTGTPASRLRPPRDVPGIVAAFWLGLVPLVLVGGAGLLIARRRQSFAVA